MNSFSPLPASSPQWAEAPSLPSIEDIQREIERRDADERRELVNRDASAIRQRCQSLIGFMREAWSIVEPGTPFIEGWAIHAVCDHLEAVSRGDIKRLLINIPPRMSKSTTVGVFWPAWEWGPRGMAHLQYLVTSYSGPNVIRDTTKMRKLVESEWYQRLWGDKVRPTDKWGEKLIINTATGQRDGRAFSKTTGGGGDRVIVDDPHDTEAAESDVQRMKAVRTFREGITDRLRDPINSVIVVVMQRLHDRDVSGEILRLGMPYVHLNLPMEYEATRNEAGRLVDARCRTYVNGELFFEDPRENDGDLLFPERFPRKEVENTKSAKGSYAYAGQYQQRPTAREGGLFKRAWFEGDADTPSRLIPFAPPCVTWVRAWDFAGTEKRANNDPDATVGLRMGRTSDGRYIIAHVDRFMASPGDTENRVKAIAALDGQPMPIRIPQDAAQAGQYQAAAYIRALAGFMVYVERPSGRKEVRATPLAIQAEHGNVWVVQGEWTAAFIDEMCNFPNGRYDDQVDAAADAFNFLAPVSTDSRYASSGPTVAAGMVEESKDAELMRRVTAGRHGASGFSLPGRSQGIL